MGISTDQKNASSEASHEHSARAIALSGVRKAYGGIVAIREASVEISRGTIHALVGENGAGKSTLLGVMSGRVRADSGSIELLGRPLSGGDPRAARNQGVVTVYQELTMIPSLTAVANVFLGQANTSAGFLNTRHMRSRYQELCAEFDISIPADAIAGRLSVSHQQMLEILRGVQSNAEVILLDEPTAALAEHERESLYRVVRQLRSRGTTIVLVSHNLEEVFDLSDRITVMRNGEVIRTADTAEWTRDTLIEAMVGRAVVQTDARERGHRNDQLLVARNVRPYPGSPGIDVEVNSGEIVGLWGLVGSGRTSFLKSLAGAMPKSTGELRLRTQDAPWPTSVRHALRQGIAMVPESRKQALVLNMSGRNNFWLGRHARRSPFISRRAERTIATRVTDFFAFDSSRIDEPVENLSGGNQQKVLLSKAAGRSPDVFLIDEPTRGIDVGAKAEVLSSLVGLADEGAGILVTSSELEEVLSICSRLLVFAHGAVVKEISRTDDDFHVDAVVALGFSDGSGKK